jgi:SAM-dependent methyltransferase
MATLRVRRAERALRGVRRRRVLDVGCGHYPYFLSRSAFDRRYGIDRERGPAWTELAATQRVMLAVADIERTPRLPFGDSTFDAVTMLAVVEHLKAETLEPLLADVRRVLADGGRFVLTTPPPWSDPVLRVLARLGLASRTELDEHQTTYTPGHVCELLERAGFLRTRAGLFELGLNVWASGER